MAFKVLTDYVFTYERDTAWDTERDFWPVGIPTEDMTFAMEANLHRFNRAMGIRGMSEENAFNDTFGKVSTATTSIRFTPQLMKELMAGILQKKVDWSPSTNVYTMYTANYADLPDPKVSGTGYFYTLVRNSPDGTNDEVIKCAIPTSINLKIAPNDADGMLTGDMEFVGTGYLRSQTQSGIIANAALTSAFLWGNTKLAVSGISFGSYNLTGDFVSAEFSITNGCKFAQDLPTGEVVFPAWKVTGSIKLLAGPNTEAMKTLCLSNTVNNSDALIIAFGNMTKTNGNFVPAANGDMQIKSQCYLNGWSSDYAEGEVIDFTFEAVFGVITSGEYPLELRFYYA